MDSKNFLIVGVGGQGTVLTSRIIGGIALQTGLDVKISEVHGMAQRGGSVVTYVRVGENIASPIIEEGQSDIVVAFESLEALRYAHYLKDGGMMIINDHRIDPMTVVTGKAQYPEKIVEQLSKDYEVISINAMMEAKKLGNPQIFNMIIIGLLAKHLEFLKEQWLDVIEHIVPFKSIEINKIAFETGWTI